MNKWTINDIPDLHGRVALVTGANSGLGLETTRALAARGAHVIMACRSLTKARQAEAEIKQSVPGASVELAQLDLASQASVHECADAIQQTHDRLDLLFNNAGVMAIPRRETPDGFEMQFATNYLGHFALTGLLLPTLLSTTRSRVVTLTSIARMFAHGRIDFDDLNGKHSYDRSRAYGQSKLATLLFADELQRRLARAGSTTISVSAHPGYARTELQSTSQAASGSILDRFGEAAMRPFMSQSAQMGALPQLYAALSPDLQGGERIGPDGLFALRGYPHIEPVNEQEENPRTAARLWDLSVELTGVDYAPLQTRQSREADV